MLLFKGTGRRGLSNPKGLKGVPSLMQTYFFAVAFAFAFAGALALAGAFALVLVATFLTTFLALAGALAGAFLVFIAGSETEFQSDN